MHRKLISRRRWIQQCAGIAAASAALKAQSPGSGKPGTASGEVPVRMIKEFEHATLQDVSPDSSMLCLYSSRQLGQSFTFSGAWKETTKKGGGDALRVLRTGPWTQVHSSRLIAPPSRGGFFGESRQFYVESLPTRHSGRVEMERLAIDLPTGNEAERLEPTFANDEFHLEYLALSNSELLGAGRNWRTAKTEALVRAGLPDYRELQRVPFAGERSASSGKTESPIMVSADRSAFVYTYDRNVVCRRASDLGMVWTRKTDPAMELWSAAISPKADLVAAYICDHTPVGFSKIHYVAIFDGRSGNELTRVVADGLESMAISPDGKLLAAGQRAPAHGQRLAGTEPTVRLFDIASGKEVSTLIQDQFYEGGRESYYAGVASWFTPDGRYLVTSGLNTRIWELGVAGVH